MALIIVILTMVVVNVTDDTGLHFGILIPWHNGEVLDVLSMYTLDGWIDEWMDG